MVKIDFQTQYDHALSIFCPSCEIFRKGCPGGAFGCQCVKPRHEALKCWRGEPCEVICLDRPDWRRHIEHPRLRPLWTGNGYCGPPVKMPSLIPVGTLRMRLRCPDVPWVALDARDLFDLTPRGARPRRWTESPAALRQAAGISKETRILVYLNAADPRLEGLYGLGPEIGPILQRLEVSLVGAPSFSVYLTRPRLDQVFNLRRMFTVMGEIEDAGVPVFPNVYSTSESDTAKWIEWLSQRPEVWVIGSVLQPESGKFFEDQVRKLARIVSGVGERRVPLHVMLYGVNSPGRARRAAMLGLQNFSCISSRAAMSAAHNQAFDECTVGRLRVVEGDRSRSRDEILAHNFDIQRREFLTALSTPAMLGPPPRDLVTSVE